MENEARAAVAPDFGTLLRHYRLAAGLSQEVLAERARMSVNGIGALERGYRRTPQRETLALLTHALGLGDDERRLLERAAARSASPRRRLGSPFKPGWADIGATKLPLSLTSFIGRDAELAEITALIHEYRVVTITGAGGVGKTQIVLRVAAALSETTQRVAFISLASVENAGSVVTAIASALGVQEAPDRPLFEPLLVHLRNKTLLLILDNCEHVIAEAATVAKTILDECPRIRILATSREPLRTSGESIYRLPSLGMPAALALFADRARAVDHHFKITDENKAVLSELCRRLDGIPLAIELAAARVNVLSIARLAERLDEALRLSTGGERTALPRQRTMRAAIDWSYNLLNPQEQRLFVRLSIFVGGCTLEGTEMVLSDGKMGALDLLDLLSSLSEKSLVVVDVTLEEPRYRLLESTRAFALEKLSEEEDRAMLMRSHAQWLAGLADHARARAETMPVEAWVHRFEPEIENARAAIDWSLASGDVLLAARIACGFTRVWRMNHGNGEPRRWLEAVLPRLDDASSVEIAAGLWHALSTVTSGMSKIQAAERAIEFESRCGNVDGIVANLYQLSQGLLEVGRVEEAEAANERGLQLCRENELTASRRYVAALDIRARVLTQRGRLDDARRYWGEALSLMSEFGDEHEATWLRINLGELEYRAGHFQQALEFAETATDAARRLHSRHREVIALTNSAAYRIALGDIEAARTAAGEALTLARGVQPLDAAIAVQHLATVAALSGDARKGARLRGYVDGRYRDEGCERGLTERRTYEMLIEHLHARLSEDEIATLAAEGAALSEEQAANEALTI